LGFLRLSWFESVSKSPQLPFPFGLSVLKNSARSVFRAYVTEKPAKLTGKSGPVTLLLDLLQVDFPTFSTGWSEDVYFLTQVNERLPSQNCHFNWSFWEFSLPEL
jgi:hypothetical protein